MNDTHTPIRRVPLTRTKARYKTTYSVIFDILLLIAAIATWILFFGIPFVAIPHLLDLHDVLTFIHTVKGN